ncbi:MAG: 30S ribosomal protein S8 [candidate division Zixibacteria bacterium]|nr:30S ribosomal protein S8 [candidate division Zixibacteria bacterium]
MSMTDPIADMLTRIRNASKARKNAVDIPASKLKRELARILKENKYVKDYIELADSKQGILRVYLKYSREDKPIITGIRRLSRPGLRRYVSSGEVFQYGFGRQGIMVVSTSSGVLTNEEATQKKVGGEAICAIW